MALADYGGMGAIEGYELAKRSNNAQSLAALQGASGVLGLRRSLQDEQENQAIRAVLSSGEQDPLKLAQALQQTGPKGVAIGQHIIATAGQQKTLEADRRKQEFLARPETKAIIANATAGDQSAYGKLLSGLAGIDAVDQVAVAKEMLAERQPKFAPPRSPGYFQGGKFVATPENVTPQMSPLARAQAELGAIPAGDPRRAAAEAYVQHLSNPQSQRISIQAPERDTPHPVVGIDANGNQVVNFVRPSQGETTLSTKPIAAGLFSSQTVRERQLAGNLDRALKPHTDVLNAYQRYQEVRASGDTSQANQILAAQINQMSKSGTARYLNKADLERQLGTTFEGGDIATRISNYVSQLATGTRTTEIDRKLNVIADAMALASAKRMGQEMQNARAAAPAGANADNITGAKPRIYGRFVVLSNGHVVSGKDAADAQAKLNAMLRAAEQEQ